MSRHRNGKNIPLSFPSRLSALIAALLIAQAMGCKPSEPVLPRGTIDVRVESRSEWITTRAPVFVNIRGMSASFVAAEKQTNVAVTFSAEAFTSGVTKRLFVRALIDGKVAAPTDVVFTEGPFRGPSSFIFTAVVTPGIHTVEMQWLVDEGATASLRDAALLVRQAGAESTDGTLTIRTAPSGPSEQTAKSTWAKVPDMSVEIVTPEDASPIVSFSAETVVQGKSKRMFVRALIDGVPLSPGNVVLAQRASRQTHRMSFTGARLKAGTHTASIEWLVDPNGIAFVGDRSMAVSAMPRSAARTQRLDVAPSGPSISTSSGEWSTVADLSTLVTVPPNGEMTVSFTGEVQTDPGARLEMRLVAGDVPGDVEATVLAQDDRPFEVQSFTFDRKHLFLSSNTFLGVRLEWRAVGGIARMGDRAMEVIIERALVPDLAEAPAIGVGNQLVEAAIGKRKVLTIIHRIQRPSPNDIIPTVAQVTDALYGPKGVADYYDRVSGGRFGLKNAGVLSYDALKSGSHYWNHGPLACDQPQSDGFAGGHVERWAEAVTLASSDVDFASFDVDKDGVLRSDELAILIIAPQQAPTGFTRSLSFPFCDKGKLFKTDGVEIPLISEWFTSAPSDDREVPMHELAHLLLGLDDMHNDNFNVNTEAGNLSLLADNIGTSTHIDPMNKLALGWVTPRYTDKNGAFSIEDVKTSGTVVVLPREADGDGKELFLLENRQSSLVDPLYDEKTNARGIIVWHIVEDAAQNTIPPVCTTASEWAPLKQNARRGLRVLRPGILFSGSFSSSWSSLGYDLEDTGLTCPDNGVARNALLWADGTASGWKIRDFSDADPAMSVTVERP